MVEYRLGTGEVLGSNPGKGENFSVKITGLFEFEYEYKIPLFTEILSIITFIMITVLNRELCMLYR